MAGWSARPGSKAKRRYATHIILLVLAIMWPLPLGWPLYTALRPIESTNERGYFSLAGPYNFDNFVTAWTQGGFSRCF